MVKPCEEAFLIAATKGGNEVLISHPVVFHNLIGREYQLYEFAMIHPLPEQSVMVIPFTELFIGFQE